MNIIKLNLYERKIYITLQVKNCNTGIISLDKKSAETFARFLYDIMMTMMITMMIMMIDARRKATMTSVAPLV